MRAYISFLTVLALLTGGCTLQSGPVRPAPTYPEIAEKDEAAPVPVSGAVLGEAKRRLATQGYAAVAEEQAWIPGGRPDFNTETYDSLDENPFLSSVLDPLSTFSIDVDTASYSNVRRFLRDGTLPPEGAVRIEELVNYFRYGYEPPSGGDPFSVDLEIAAAPWNPAHRLARIGLRGEEIALSDRAGANLVFLLDVSGSMRTPNKLPLLQSAMKMLVHTLRGDDTVSIVVYAGAAGLVLPATPASDAAAILEAIDGLEAGGSTAGGAGIRLAYATARENFIPGGINRVILATDGDFNVGVTDQSELVRMIEKEASGGTFLTVLGFGMGNLKDSTLEKLADRGNGNYGYIDSRLEARKMLVEQVGATLVTIAKDVKIQVEFNPSRVAAYRLIGYENRMLRNRDFNDDTRDAGEIGAGHTVTALYELVPTGVEIDLPGVDSLKYQRTRELTDFADSDELFHLKLRYKEPDGSDSRLLTFPVADRGSSLASASPDFKFAAAVASFGMILRRSEHCGSFTLEDTAALARQGAAGDVHGYRTEFLELVERARELSQG